jgi:MazG family protein
MSASKGEKAEKVKIARAADVFAVSDGPGASPGSKTASKSAPRSKKELSTPAGSMKTSKASAEKEGRSAARPELPPPGPSPDAFSALARLDKLLDGLLDPVLGCPWDRRQTTKSLTEDFLEEVYELRQALLEDGPADVLEESGDVAFLLVFLARLTKRSWNFGLAEMLDAAVDKMLRRHPHVFGDAEIGDDMDAFFKLWHRLKRAAKPKEGTLASVPKALPALTRCHRLAQKAGRAGFDFPSAGEARRTLDRELVELDAELAKLGNLDSFDKKTEPDPSILARIEHELGDALASTVNLARMLGISAEKTLDAYNRRFVTRFGSMEAALAERGLKPEEAEPELLETLWRQAKEGEKARAKKVSTGARVGPDGMAKKRSAKNPRGPAAKAAEKMKSQKGA